MEDQRVKKTADGISGTSSAAIWRNFFIGETLTLLHIITITISSGRIDPRAKGPPRREGELLRPDVTYDIHLARNPDQVQSVNAPSGRLYHVTMFNSRSPFVDSSPVIISLTSDMAWHTPSGIVTEACQFSVPADVVLPGKALNDMPTASPPTGSNCVLKSSRDPLEYTYKISSQSVQPFGIPTTASSIRIEYSNSSSRITNELGVERSAEKGDEVPARCRLMAECTSFNSDKKVDCSN
ncbi:hypothetical protein EVAR_51261_1 [Eumeta japonica]|uniref:Uncharacterized protein n=1 Tax=Eumeta variegata TaxID=151549 RepID=A0A4C1YAU5_EUMVA|nr:hypothetical protein EVAR_51261_1 [Eumeta japonica]